MTEVIFATLDDIAGIEDFESHTLAARILLYIEGSPANSELVLRFLIPDTVQFPADWTGSLASATVASTGSVAFSIAKNGSEIGTVTFASSESGVVAGAGDTFEAGDILTITAPASADATLANVSITLAGTRVP